VQKRDDLGFSRSYSENQFSPCSTPERGITGRCRKAGNNGAEHLAPKEMPDDEYPLMLTTGRMLYHWHGAEMTRQSHALLQLYPKTAVEIRPEDAARIGLNGRKMVRVISRRGEMVAEALITDRVCPGLIFGNFHFPGMQNVNNLTIAALDPVAKIPEYKVCAVRMEPL
jgi:formate dehydrogenase major subunit/formate dehydrogenase alpha subunit